MAEAARNWASPQWVRYDKHRPPPGLAWKTIVSETGKPDGRAYYHPSISVAEQEKMEVECAVAERMFWEHGHKRMYFIDCGDIIGASCGEETAFLYVEVLSNGQLHGRPITADQLREKRGQSMSEIALRDWIPQNVRATVKGVLLREYSPDELALLDQDVLEVSLSNQMRIDVGWYPENDPKGRFVIRVYRQNQAAPVQSAAESRNPIDVARIVGDLAGQYGKPSQKAMPVACTSSTSVRVDFVSLNGFCWV